MTEAALASTVVVPLLAATAASCTSLLTDLWSRKIVVYHAGDTLEAEGAVRALETALKELPKGAFPIHHSDRGCRYCSHRCVEKLKAQGLSVSRHEETRCYENARAERLNVIALTCGEPPAGRSRWTLQLPADTAKEWCIPEASAEFVERMEDVPETYTPPYDPARPMVCLDETSRQLIGETKTPLPVRPGQPGVYEYDYVRKGAADNLNTHSLASLYAAFPPEQARS